MRQLIDPRTGLLYQLNQRCTRELRKALAASCFNKTDPMLTQDWLGEYRRGY